MIGPCARSNWSKTYVLLYGYNSTRSLIGCWEDKIFLYYHILTSSVIYYWTDTRQHNNETNYYRLRRPCGDDSDFSSKKKHR